MVSSMRLAMGFSSDLYIVGFHGIFMGFSWDPDPMLSVGCGSKPLCEWEMN
jgi:hypothetical protein